jgi:hypothetical protein
MPARQIRNNSYLWHLQALLHGRLVNCFGRARITTSICIDNLMPLFARCEFFQPLNRGKDRIGAGEREGKVHPYRHIIEPTSGNTGIALAFVCAAKGCLVKNLTINFLFKLLDDVSNSVLVTRANNEVNTYTR